MGLVEIRVSGCYRDQFGRGKSMMLDVPSTIVNFGLWYGLQVWAKTSYYFSQMCASLPTLWPLVTKYFPRLSVSPRPSKTAPNFVRLEDMTPSQHSKMSGDRQISGEML